MSHLILVCSNHDHPFAPLEQPKILTVLKSTSARVFQRSSDLEPLSRDLPSPLTGIQPLHMRHASLGFYRAMGSALLTPADAHSPSKVRIQNEAVRREFCVLRITTEKVKFFIFCFLFFLVYWCVLLRFFLPPPPPA